MTSLSVPPAFHCLITNLISQWLYTLYYSLIRAITLRKPKSYQLISSDSLISSSSLPLSYHSSDKPYTLYYTLVLLVFHLVTGPCHLSLSAPLLFPFSAIPKGFFPQRNVNESFTAIQGMLISGFLSIINFQDGGPSTDSILLCIALFFLIFGVNFEAWKPESLKARKPESLKLGSLKA